MASPAPTLVPPLQEGVEQLTELDNQSLTPQIKNLLAEGLVSNNTWREFALATDLIPDHTIKQLDSGSSRIATEKCYEMLTKWEQLSRAQVTVAMAKLILIKIKRNDLHRKLSSLLGSHSGEHTLARPVLTIQDLRYSQKRHIAECLDIDSCWKYAGFQIFKNDKSAQEIIETLHSGYIDGKSPAKLLFEVIMAKKPQLTAQKIIDIARVHKRLDIAGVLRQLNLPEGYRYSEVRLAEHSKILRLMDKSTNVWKYFAEGLGLTRQEISSINSSARIDPSHRPSEALIELVTTRLPDFTLHEFAKIASDIRRNDVALYIRNVIDELDNANMT